jgi:CheY-like chemotaxis protein
MRNILVVDDESSIRTSIVELLQADGYNAFSAADGKAGLSLARERRPDVVLCDVMMPGLDGYDVLTALRKDPMTATIPFIFLTGQSDQNHHRVGMNLGADDYITKPFTRAHLLKSIVTRLEKNASYDRQLEEKLDDVRVGLARSLPHEMLDPIKTVLGYSELLAGGYASMQGTDVLDAAQRIYSAGKRLQRLIQNFLICVELETLATDPEKEKALISGEVTSPRSLTTDTAVEKARQLNRENDLRLELENATLKISEVHFRKIVEELVDNAFRYSDPGSTVLLSGRVIESQFELTIMDHGRGMSPEQIAGIGARLQFERKIYEQQGSGLGLTIVKRLLALNNGELTLESTPEVQTTVRARFQRKSSPA